MLQVEIRFKGQIAAQWSEWFGGLTVAPGEGEETTLSGTVVDQAAFYGLIARLRDLGLTLISVHSNEMKA